jgi:hypothetical protein
VAPRKRILTPGKAREAKPAPETPAQPVDAGNAPEAPPGPAEAAPKDDRTLGEQDDAPIDNRLCGACGQPLPGPPIAEKRIEYSPELADRVLSRLAMGEPLKSIGRDPLMPAASTVVGWATRDVDGFAERYRAARNSQLEMMAEDLLDIAEDSSLDWEETEKGKRVNGEVVNRSKLRVHARMWLLSKLKPETYGDRLNLNHSGSIDVNRLEDQQLTAMLEGALYGLGVPDELMAQLKPYITVTPLPDRATVVRALPAPAEK